MKPQVQHALLMALYFLSTDQDAIANAFATKIVIQAHQLWQLRG